MEQGPKELTRAEMGGIARAEKLSKTERSDSARKAAEARWGADLPRATHDGPLPLGDATLMAAVLPNGKRLIVQGTMLTAIGRSRTPKAGTGGSVNVDGLPFFLSAEVLSSFITDELRLSTTPIFFRLKGGQRALGYDALLLPMVCKVYQDLRDSLMKKLAKGNKKESDDAKHIYARYEHIIARCDALSHGFGKRGIIALVDDATGYQADKARDEALKIIEQYVSPSYLIPWTQMFRHDFFREAYKILGWEYKPGSVKHPQYLGKFIIKYIYDPLPPGVLEELKRKLPKNEHGNRRAKLWQALTPDTGIPHLDRQLTAVITLMGVSDDKQTFDQHFDRLFGKQQHLPFGSQKLLPEGGRS
jgi:hypothetical protein